MRAVRELINRKYYKYTSMTFTSSSNFQSFTVPSTTTKLIVDCVASKGAGTKGGKGGRVQCILPVMPSSTLYFYIGGVPSTTDIAEYNASDIRTNNDGVLDTTSLSSRLIVAGGGGSGSGSDYTGGSGGGLVGGTGEAAHSSYGGTGGTQSTGGEGYTSDYNGAFGIGGNAALSSSGAGGGGWYGGGGGGGTSSFFTYQGAGGGGSSYTDSSCTHITHTQGYNAGTGYIKITYAVQSTPYDYDFYTDEALYKAKNVAFNNTPVYYAPISMNAGRYVNPIKLTGYTVVGNLTIVDGVASGFSGSDYVQSSSTFPGSTATSLEFSIKFNISSFASTSTIASSTSSVIPFHLAVRDSKFRLYPGREDIYKVGNFVLSANTDYWIKLFWDSTNGWKLQYSTDGINYTTDFENYNPSDSAPKNNYIVLGRNYVNGGQERLLGTLDLNNTYIKINNTYWFRGDLPYGIQSIE